MESLFPRLLPGVVVHLLQTSSYSSDTWEDVDEQAIEGSELSHAMLFEVATTVAEWMLFGDQELNWSEILKVASARQAKYFDSRPTSEIPAAERSIAIQVGRNLVGMINGLRKQSSEEIVCEPRIPGCGWVSPGTGDFSIGDALIEVKCSASRFQAADFRQVLMYWLLSYVHALEHGTICWRRGILLNPRINLALEFDFESLAALASGGRSNLELAQALTVAVEYEGQK